MMNFDEFRAASERERLIKIDRKENASGKSTTTSGTKISEDTTTEKDLLQQIGAAKKTKTSNEKPTMQSSKLSTSFGIGDFLEMHQMQSFVLAMIILDTFASFAELYLSKERSLQKIASRGAIISPLSEIMLLALQSFTTFSIVFFAIEILSVIMVFRTSIIGHLGYILDFFVISLQLWLEMILGAGKETRILNVFRLWRAIRLFNAIVNVEKELHEQTKVSLVGKDFECRKLKVDIQRFEVDLSKEKEAKDAVEDMLQTYKEEVDTLNEALKIAAMDIAEVAQGDSDFDSENDNEDNECEEENSEDNEEDNEENEIDDENYVDAPNSENDKNSDKNRNKNKNRETLLRLAGQDATDSNVHSNSRSSGSTFIIKEDGSFEQSA
jgi:hypothetical protein